MIKKKMTLTQIKQAAKRYDQGWSLCDLADEYGTYPSTVGRYLKNVGVAIRDRGRPIGSVAVKIAPRSRSRIARLRAEGKTLWQIAKEYGVSPKRISSVLEQA